MISFVIVIFTSNVKLQERKFRCQLNCNYYQWGALCVPPAAVGSGVLGVPQGKEFPELPWERGLREALLLMYLQGPSSVLPGEAQPRMRATAQIRPPVSLWLAQLCSQLSPWRSGTGPAKATLWREAGHLWVGKQERKNALWGV